MTISYKVQLLHNFVLSDARHTLEWPNEMASTIAASRHSTTLRLYRPSPVSALLDTVRELATTKVALFGSKTSEALTCPQQAAAFNQGMSSSHLVTNIPPLAP
jgi:hypothetical protein